MLYQTKQAPQYVAEPLQNSYKLPVMKSFKILVQIAAFIFISALIGCDSDKGIECGSIGDFSQESFRLSMTGIEEINFQNYAHFNCFLGYNYHADTYGRAFYNINGFEYYTRQSKLEMYGANGSKLIIDFHKAFLSSQEDENDANWHGKAILDGDFVFGIDGTQVSGAPYTSQTALLWANYPTIVTITYFDASGREWRSEDVIQLASASFEINGFQEVNYSPQGATTTQYDFNFIANGNITCTLKSRDELNETKQLIDASFYLPFHLIK
ncbi:MAG: hypothetical protein ACPGJS_00195 [Flammeovirgaceae bacterium]